MDWLVSFQNAQVVTETEMIRIDGFSLVFSENNDPTQDPTNGWNMVELPIVVSNHDQLAHIPTVTPSSVHDAEHQWMRSRGILRVAHGRTAVVCQAYAQFELDE